MFLLIFVRLENKREEAWTHEETVLLIELWGDQRVHEQLENTPKRNLEIFKQICQDIKDRLELKDTLSADFNDHFLHDIGLKALVILQTRTKNSMDQKNPS